MQIDRYRPRYFSPDQWEVAIKLVPEEDFWKHYRQYERNAQEPEILAIQLLSEYLLGKTQWRMHGNGLISRKFGSGLAAVTFSIDVCSTVQSRRFGDEHIRLHVFTWPDETRILAGKHDLEQFRVCVLPSYEAASGDSCLAIVMAAEKCNLGQMFHLVPRSKNSVARQIESHRSNFNLLSMRIATVYSNAQPELFRSWKLSEFEDIYRTVIRIKDERAFRIRDNSDSGIVFGADHHPRIETWSRFGKHFLDSNLTIPDLSSRLFEMGKAIETLSSIEEMGTEFPELGKEIALVRKKYQQEEWSDARHWVRMTKELHATLVKEKKRRLAHESSAKKLIVQAGKFLDDHPNLSESHGEYYCKSVEAIQRGDFDKIHDLLKPLIRRGNELDIEQLVHHELWSNNFSPYTL